MANISLIKRNSFWQYRFDIAKQDGKRKQVSKSGFKTKKEAKEAGLKALNSYLDSGSFQRSTSISLSDYLDLWFKAYCLVQSRFNTQRVHGNSIQKHIKPVLGKFYLDSINSFQIQQFLNALKLSGYSKRSISNIFSTLNIALNYAVHTLKYLKVNPCNGVQIPKFESEIVRPKILITPSDFRRILERFPAGTPEYLPLVIGYYTGMRIAEVFALCWEDIDLNKGTISVNKIIEIRNYKENSLKLLSNVFKDRAINGWFLGPTKTPTSRRIIPIGPTLVNILREELKRQEEAKKLFGKEYIELYKKPEKDEKGNTIYRLVPISAALPKLYSPIHLICRRNRGTYFPFTSMNSSIKIIKNELKIPFHFHALRHTHATMLIQAGANIKDVQARLGHSKASITLDIYGHQTEEMSLYTINVLEKQFQALEK